MRVSASSLTNQPTEIHLRFKVDDGHSSVVVECLTADQLSCRFQNPPVPCFGEKLHLLNEYMTSNYHHLVFFCWSSTPLEKSSGPEGL